MFEYKKNLLFEFVEINNRIPTQKESFKNINIGTWFQTQKIKIKFNTDENYIELSQNNIVKKKLDDYLKKEKYEFSDMLTIFLKFVNLNNRTPKKRELYENINIGSWFQHQKEKINSNTDETYIKLAINDIIAEELNRYLNKKHNK